MYKRLLALALCLAMLLTIPIYASAAGVTAKPTTSGVALNGNNIRCSAYNISGNNYFKLRDLMQALNKSVTYDGTTNTILIDTTKSYVPDGSEGAAQYNKNETAVPTTSKVTLNGVVVNWTAYNIGGNNYFKLRDILKALNIFVYFSSEFNVIYIDTSKGYVDETPPVQGTTPPSGQATEVIADGSGKLSETPVTKKVLDGKDMAREDFSQTANSAVFDSIYTRAAYNAIRQSIVDREIILSKSNDKGFNPYYHYAHVIATAESRAALVPTLISMSTYNNFTDSAEPYIEKIYQYPNYMSFMPKVVTLIDAAEKNVAPLIEQSKTLPTIAEKIKMFNTALCDRMDYDANSDASMNTIFDDDAKTKGQCGSFANAFAYLCDRAGIPCIVVSGENHSWNAVYVDAKWLYVDVSANTKITTRDSLLLATASRKTDAHPKSTAFAMELVAPNSTK